MSMFSTEKYLKKIEGISKRALQFLFGDRTSPYEILFSKAGNERNTAYKKITFSIKDFFSNCNQIRRKLRISPHLLKESFMENSTFCAV